MSRSARRAVADAAAPLGFGVESVTTYTRRVVGEYRNEEWHEVKLLCPCGNKETIHIRNTSMPWLATELREHLERDGLL